VKLAVLTELTLLSGMGLRLTWWLFKDADRWTVTARMRVPQLLDGPITQSTDHRGLV
jgi:hypothetical protein